MCPPDPHPEYLSAANRMKAPEPADGSDNPADAPAWLAAIVDSANDAIVSKDASGKIMTWNRSAERLFGYSAAEMIGQTVAALIPPDRVHEEEGILQKIRAGERVEHYETVRRRKNGSLVEVSLTVSPVRNAQGEVVGASKIAREITDRRETEDAQRQLAAIVESSDDAILSKDLDGVIRSWNPGAERLFGYTAAEAIGRSVTMLIPLGRHNEEPEILARVRRGERIDHYETIRRRKDGSLVDVSLTVSPVRNAVGQIVGASKIARNIGDQKTGDSAIRRLAAIVESSDDAVISKNLSGIIQSWNRGAERLFGYTAAETIGRPIVMLIPEGRRAEETAILARLRRGERVDHFETVRQHQDGSLIDVSISVSPIINALGHIIGASKIARDISQQKKVLRELQETQQRAIAANRAKDDFIAALSHELRTPLNPVLLMASAAAADATLPARVRQDFESIRKHIELEARLIDDLLDLSKITKGKLTLSAEVLDLQAIVREAIATIRPDVETKNQTLTFTAANTAIAVSGDATRLQQVMWNVLKNAVKFTPEGGRIAVIININPARHCATVEIRDSGRGIAPDELERIFDAFAQAQETAQAPHRFGGLGLGLTISRMIMELHHGSIRAVSGGEGRGATFLIELPLATFPNDGTAPNGAGNPELARNVTENIGPKRRILLVEDHAPSGAALARLLTRRGFEVFTATTGAEARSVAARQGFDIVISDIGLPDLDGCDLIAELRDQYGLRSIALTGYGMDTDIERCHRAGAIAHLTKPVSMQVFDRALAEAFRTT